MNKQKLILCLRDLSESEIIRIHNEINQDYDYIYNMSDFNDLYNDYTPLQIADLIHNRDEFFTIDDEYFYYNRCGNITSFSDINDTEFSPINYDYIADYMIRNNQNFDISTIQS